MFFFSEEVPINERRIRGHGVSLIFYGFSHFDLPPMLHFFRAAGPARRTAETLWGRWNFTFKDVCTKYWTNWCIRVHITVVTRQLCHTPKTNFQEQSGRMTTMQEASCLIVRLSLQTDCLVLVLVVTGLVLHFGMNDSECCEGIGEGEKQNRWVWGAANPSTGYRGFIWFRTFHISEIPQFEYIARITCFAFKKSRGVKLLHFRCQKKLQSMKEASEATGFPWIFYSCPTLLSASVALISDGLQALKEKNRELEAQLKDYEVDLKDVWTKWWTKLVYQGARLSYECLPHIENHFSRNKSEAWQIGKNTIHTGSVLVFFGSIRFGGSGSIPEPSCECLPHIEFDLSGVFWKTTNPRGELFDCQIVISKRVFWRLFVTAFGMNDSECGGGMGGGRKKVGRGGGAAKPFQCVYQGKNYGKGKRFFFVFSRPSSGSGGTGIGMAIGMCGRPVEQRQKPPCTCLVGVVWYRPAA